MLKATVDIWATLIKDTEFLTVFQFVGNMEVDKKKIFFNKLDLAVWSSYIILSSCGSRIDYQKFHLTVAPNLLEMTTIKPCFWSIPRISHTNKPVSWFTEKLEKLNTGKFEDHSCIVVCIETGRNEQWPNLYAQIPKMAWIWSLVLIFITQR